MKKLLLLSAFANTLFLAAAPYKSTQDVINDIFETYNALLPDVGNVSKRNMATALKNLGNRVDAHIMSKQSLLIGKTTALTSNEYWKLCNYDVYKCKNVFDIWHRIFGLFTELVNALQKDLPIGTIDAPLHDIFVALTEIRKETILDSKKKLIDIMIFFNEHTIEFINAVRKAKYKAT